jgi:hypothetical protein
MNPRFDRNGQRHPRPNRDRFASNRGCAIFRSPEKNVLLISKHLRQFKTPFLPSPRPHFTER